MDSIETRKKLLPLPHYTQGLPKFNLMVILHEMQQTAPKITTS